MSVLPDTTSSIAAPTAPRVARQNLKEQRRFESGTLSIALFWIIAAVFIAARFWRLTSYGLFGDEVFTLWTADQHWKSLFASVVGDVVHPPLFYVLLKLWIGIGGQTISWLKLLPVLFSIGSLVPFFFLCCELKLHATVMNLALWLMAVNGFLISHSQELRMYSLLLFLTLGSFWLFAKIANQDSKRTATQILLFVVNLLLVFTHYYGWVVVAIELVFLLMFRRQHVRSL